MEWLFKKFGLSIRFDDPAPAGDANDANAAGGAADPAKAGGGGSPAKDESYTLKIDGEDKVVISEAS